MVGDACRRRVLLPRRPALSLLRAARRSPTSRSSATLLLRRPRRRRCSRGAPAVRRDQRDYRPIVYTRPVIEVELATGWIGARVDSFHGRVWSSRPRARSTSIAVARTSGRASASRPAFTSRCRCRRIAVGIGVGVVGGRRCIVHMAR